VVGVDVIKNIIYLFSVFLYSIKGAFAETLAAGTTKLKSVFNFYHQNSNDGTQVYDGSGREEVNVVEPMFFVQHQIDEHTNVNAQFVLDFWTAASDTKLDGQTGASGEGIYGQSRLSAKLGAQKEKGDWSYGGSFGFSSEYDYRSLNASLNAAKSFAQKNFTLGFGIQYYKDEVDLFQDLTPASTAEITQGLERNILSTSVTATQLLTVKDIIQFGFNYVKATNFLESTASSVVVNGLREVEKLPDTRNRYAFSTKWVHGLSDISAFHLDYRYYTDDWDLNANSIKASYYLEVNEEDEDYIEFFLRYHQQDRVKYFAKSFPTELEFMTSDSDLDEFTSTETGFFYRNWVGDKKFFGLDLEEFEWGSGIVLFQRDNGMRYGYIQTSVGVQF
jgi:hypothetical protein